MKKLLITGTLILSLSLPTAIVAKPAPTSSGGVAATLLVAFVSLIIFGNGGLTAGKAGVTRSTTNTTGTSSGGAVIMDF